MSHIAFVGPEIEENLSLRYLASTLAAHGHTTDIVPFNVDADFAGRDTVSDGFNANDLIREGLRRQQARRAAAIAAARVEAEGRRKEQFDLERLATMCDTMNFGRPDPDDLRRERFEHMYYVEHPEMMTLAELAELIEDLNRW